MKITISSLFFLRSLLMAYEINAVVVDETGASVSGSDVRIVFIHGNQETVHDGRSDDSGMFRATGRPTNSAMAMVEKSGYYSARIENLSSRADRNIEVVLPRVLSPIPLYGWRSSGLAPAPVFPAQGQWFGFDFEEADWVAPHGKGKTPDILFRFKNEFKGWAGHFGSIQKVEEEIVISKEVYAARKEEWTLDKFKITAGKWDGVMEISFPGEGEGLFEVKKFLAYSQLKMPHSAPADGYVPSWRYTSNNYSPRTYRSDVGFFLRTRVKLDKEGKVISANYAKVIGDFRLDAARSSVGFTYYFNPVPNDRNLEFDPKKNLFPKDKPGANVYDP